MTVKVRTRFLMSLSLCPHCLLHMPTVSVPHLSKHSPAVPPSGTLHAESFVNGTPQGCARKGC